MAAGERAEGALAGLCRGKPGRGGPRGPSWASGERRHPRPGLAAAAAAVAAPHVGGFPRMHLPPPPLRPAASPRLPSAPRARGSRARDGLLLRYRRRRFWKASPGGEGLRPARPRPAPGIAGRPPALAREPRTSRPLLLQEEPSALAAPRVGRGRACRRPPRRRGKLSGIPARGAAAGACQRFAWIPTKHEFSVDMTCEGCANAVTHILNKLGGVQFDIDLPNKKVCITSEHSVDTLLETLEKTGKAVSYLGPK
ncbi:unnamed protein product [Rangifer tarandus platyrhynchus]|uniref:Copper transport protein ATOX1 n=1 Tax=Rangifer tarandus platyrhynchus TaxID=3082113 RepID=A0ABN8XYK2_RANTA|nr:unnamed protein product [Rangifer tarandus platyrhynchus]